MQKDKHTNRKKQITEKQRNKKTRKTKSKKKQKTEKAEKTCGKTEMQPNKHKKADRQRESYKRGEGDKTHERRYIQEDDIIHKLCLSNKYIIKLEPKMISVSD